MLRVTIELVPYGDEWAKKKISCVEIANTGTGSDELGDYMVRRGGDLKWSPGPKKIPRGEEHLHRLVSEALKMI